MLPSNFFVSPESIFLGEKGPNGNTLKLAPVNKNPVKDLMFKILLKD